MATDIKRHMLSFHPVQYGGKGSVGSVKVYREITTSTYEYGAPLVYDTSSEAVKLATDSTVAGIGLALTPASGTENADVPVYVFNENTILRAPVLNAGAVAAASRSQIGVKYSWVARTDGYGYGIDTSDSSSNDWFQVIDLAGEDDDDPGFVYVRPIAAVLLAVIVS